MVHSASQNNCVIDQIRHLKPDLVQPAVKFDWLFVTSCGCRQGRFNLFGSGGTDTVEIQIWKTAHCFDLTDERSAFHSPKEVVCCKRCWMGGMSLQLSQTTFQFLSTCEYYVTTALTDHIPVPLNLWVLHHHISHWPHSSSFQLVSITSPQLSLTKFQFLSTCEYYIRDLPPPCCVLEQDTLLPESTG